MSMQNAKLVMAVVCEVYGLDAKDISSKTKTKTLVEARQLFALLARDMLGLSYPELGMVVKRDHTSMIQAVRAARARLAKDKRTKKLHAHCVKTVHTRSNGLIGGDT